MPPATQHKIDLVVDLRSQIDELEGWLDVMGSPHSLDRIAGAFPQLSPGWSRKAK